MPIPAAEWPKAMVCGYLLARIKGSNPPGVLNVSFMCVLHVVRCRSLSRADPSSRGVLWNVECLAECD